MQCMAVLLCADLLLVCQIHPALLGAQVKVEEWKTRQICSKDDWHCVMIAKKCTQKGLLQTILGKNSKRRAACTICSSTDIYIQESWKLEEIMQCYYFIHKRNYTELSQHGCILMVWETSYALQGTEVGPGQEQDDWPWPWDQIPWDYPCCKIASKTRLWHCIPIKPVSWWPPAVSISATNLYKAAALASPKATW